NQSSVQVRRQLPESQQILLQRSQRRNVCCPLACCLDDGQADPLKRFEQQLRTWSLRLSAWLPWIQPFQRLLLLLQLLPHRPLQQRQQTQRQTQQQHQTEDSALLLQIHRRQPQRLPLQPRPVVLQPI